MRSLLAIALLLVAAPGCHLLFSHAQAGDARAAELGAPDAGRDAPGDAAIDAARPEDARRVDAAPDAPRVDTARVDLPRKDTSPAPPAAACSTAPVNGAPPSVVMEKAGAPLVVSSNGHHLIGCEYASGPITQCDAIKACTLPWKLCTPDKYALALPTAETPDGLEWGWLAGCVRKAGVNGLTQTPCLTTNCTLGMSTALVKTPLMVDCSKPTPLPFPSGTYADAGVPLANHVGLMSYYQNWCWFPPSPGGAAGLWAPCPADGQKGCVGGGNKTPSDPRRALCCWP
jgi:hypothetical protein